jgi:type III secretion protein L
MSNTVIKSGEMAVLDAIRGFHPVPMTARSLEVDTERARLTDRLGRLEEELRQSRADTAALQKDVTAAFTQGEQKGFEAGQKAASDLAIERRNILKAGVDEALALYNDHLAGAERLAALLARECLDKIFGDDTDHTERLYAVLRHQLNQLDADNILKISVSPEDFNDLKALMIDREEIHDIMIHRNPSLSEGQVQIELTLGTLSAGIDQQWSRLRGVLDDLAGAEQ